jgi:hypothetical protein
VAFDVTGFVQPFEKGRKDSLVTLGRTGADKTNNWHRRLNPGLIRKAAESELKAEWKRKKRGIGETGLVETENAAAC